jgi:serine/threonine protein kinase/Cdc6-like AAA superfamily ATPase
MRFGKPSQSNEQERSSKQPFTARQHDRLSVAFPFDRNFNQYKSGMPLKTEFRFAHEPVPSDSANGLIGRQSELDIMAERILFSNGGSFLVTGYRGVGKTSFVNQVIHRLETIMPWAETFLGNVEVLHVHLNVARPMQPAELMHHIIRRLYDKLIESGIYRALPSDLREELTLAYRRTSINMKRSVGDAMEWNLTAGNLGAGAGKYKIGFSLPIGFKRSLSQSQESAFLGYDDKAAEYDVTHLSRRLAAGYIKPRSLWQHLMQWLWKKPPTQIRLKMIFVFDELDKLEGFVVEENGVKKPFIDEILNSLKNLFTTSGISFIFIAGKDLQESWLEDLGRGDSVYESVFSYDKYLPCLWEESDLICDNLVDWQELSASKRHPDIDAKRCHRCNTVLQLKQMFCSQCGLYGLDNADARLTFDEFKKYLGYRGRGIPRRMIRGFNEYVQWNEIRPVLTFSCLDIRRIRFYANLQDVLKLGSRKLFENRPEEAIAQRDKQLLGMYYLVDWILHQSRRKFTLKEAVSASKQLSSKIAFAEEIAPQMIVDILEILLKSDYLKTVQFEMNQVHMGDLDNTNQIYQLSLKCLGEMSGLADNFQEEDYALLPEEESLQLGSYKLVEKIGTGGMATVYRAWDDEHGMFVAVKVLSQRFSPQAQAIERFKREGQVQSRFNHPHIVRYYGSGEDRGKFYIAMDYVDGLDLNTVLQLQVQRRLNVDMAISILYPIVEALDYIFGEGFVRSDVKPSNILLSRSGKVYLSDFGITKLNDNDTTSEAVTIIPVVIGTPEYISPEQWENKAPDARSDIYALGVVLYEVLTGQRPFEGNFQDLKLAHQSQQPLPPSQRIAILPELEFVILRCLAKDPKERFQSLSELKAALSPFWMPVELTPFIERTMSQLKAAEEKSQSNTINMSPPSVVPHTLTSPPIDSSTVLNPPTGKVSVPRTVYSTAADLPLPSQSPPTVIPVVPDPTNSVSAPTPVASALVPPANPEPYLLIYKPNATLTHQILTQHNYYLGRSMENDIVLDTIAASRIHARVVLDRAEFVMENRYMLEDLNSNNGTYVNGIPIQNRHLLQDRDKIQIGEYVIEFRQD